MPRKKGQPCPTCGKGWDSNMDGNCAFCGGSIGDTIQTASHRTTLDERVAILEASLEEIRDQVAELGRKNTLLHDSLQDWKFAFRLWSETTEPER